jgi:hypothetical protein
MLRNAKNQIVNVPAKFNTKDNPSLFANLRETKELSDPNGRSTGGLFSIEQRCKVITYSAPANTGKKISNRRRIALHW